MPNYESTSYHVEQDFDPEKSVAYSTFTDKDGLRDNGGTPTDDDFVLRVWHTTRLPDGQPVNVEVLHTADDVKGLQSFLNDNFGRNKKPAEAATLDWRSMPDAQEPYDDRAVTPRQAAEDLVQTAEATGHGGNGMAEPSDFYGGESDGYSRPAQSYSTVTSPNWPTGHTGEYVPDPQPRQCPAISNGMQCNRPEGHGNTDGMTHYFPSQPMTGDGAATPPAAPTTTAVGAAGEQAVASANGAVNTAAAPSSAPAEPPKRTRRKKEEKAYDDAFDAYTANKGNETWGALSEAYEALKKRLPDNPRIAAGNAIGLGGPSEMGNPPPEPYNPPVAEAPAVVGFAPEPGGQMVAPWMEAPVLPQTEMLPAANYIQQAQHPMNQQFAQAVAQLPGEHVGDTIYMTTEEAQASQAFPCPAHHTDGRQCVRPFGHELQTANNPEPKPHMYATDPGALPNPTAPPMQPAQGFAVSQPVSTPVGSQLPYAVPPTPEQPNIPPAAPVWSQ